MNQDRAKLNSKISFLHQCYRSDNRELHLPDVFNPRKVEKLKLVQGHEELINGATPKIPIDSKHGEALQKVLQVYKKEKELIYTSLFVIGMSELLGKPQRICAPLLIYNAALEHSDDYYFVKLEGKTPRINYPVLRMLARQNKNVDWEATLLKEFPKDEMDFTAIGQFSRILKKCFPDLVSEDMALFPKLWEEKKLKRRVQPAQLAKKEHFEVLCASGYGIVSKSQDTYGILSELDQLEKTETLSSPIKQVLNKIKYVSGDVDKRQTLPVVLSEAQLDAVYNARQQKVSMVVGPPGTGKSFTIACIAIDAMLQGQSVLISSRQNEAVDVVSHKLKEILGSDEVYVRSGAKTNLTKFKRKIRRILTLKRFQKNKQEYAHDYRYQLLRTAAEIQQLESAFQDKLDEELRWSRQLFETGLVAKVKTGITKMLHGFYKPHWETLSVLNKLLDKRVVLSKKLIQATYANAVRDVRYLSRNVFEELLAAIGTRNSGGREQLFDNIDLAVVLKAFPIWLCRITEVYKVLPLKREMFDLLVIDEASQVDMASVLPLMQRAKRVVICGDPNQLNHVSFLSRAKSAELGRKNGLSDIDVTDFDFRNKSVLDMVSSKIETDRQVAFLDEHFRSVPEIIEFSNREFYSQALKVMTQKPIKTEGYGVFAKNVEGERDKDGVNKKEASAILEAIKKTIKAEEELPVGQKSSIGISSPLRAQAEFLAKLLTAELTLEEIESHEIMVGTPYSFQGEERDEMHLSFAIDVESHHSAKLHIDNPNVFNVLITRARSKQFVYHSILSKELPTDHYLRMYLEYTESAHVLEHKHEVDEHDSFMKEVLKYLKRVKAQFWVYYSIAGIPVDILVKTPAGLKGIDLIGYPGLYEDSISINRYKVQSRTGLKLFPLPYTFWKYRQQDCKYQLRKFLALN